MHVGPRQALAESRDVQRRVVFELIDACRRRHSNPPCRPLREEGRGRRRRSSGRSCPMGQAGIVGASARPRHAQGLARATGLVSLWHLSISRVFDRGWIVVCRRSPDVDKLQEAHDSGNKQQYENHCAEELGHNKPASKTGARKSLTAVPEAETAASSLVRSWPCSLISSLPQPS